MSSRNIQQNSIANRGLLGATYLNDEWIRNPSWLPLTSITSAEQKFTGLYRINRFSNFIAFSFTTSGGAQYSINWGDGSSPQLVNSGVQANYEYDWNDADLNNTDAPVTFTDSTNTVNRTAHGYQNGMTISFDTIVTTTGITATQTYFVVNAAADTFQVSSTLGGAAIDLVNDGSGTILPFKQVVVTVTPVSGDFTACNLNLKHNQSGLQNGYATGWLDIALAGNYTSLNINGSGSIVRHIYQQANILSSALTSYSSLFETITPGIIAPLQNIVGINSSASVTSTTNMFRGCLFKKAPLFNTANVTNMTQMFSGCLNLEIIPLYNTVNVTNMSSMFSGCDSLRTIPLLNTTNVTNISGMFRNCSALNEIPLFNTANVTNMSGMFDNFGGRGCVALTKIPLLNTIKVTNMSNMFNGCVSLSIVPSFNTSNVTIFGGGLGGMFQSCSSLTTAPTLDTSIGVTTSSMFSGCTSLINIPLYNTANVTNMSSMFSSCLSLQTTPLFNTGNATNMTNMFSNDQNIIEIPAFDLRKADTLPFTNFLGSIRRIKAYGAVINFSVQGYMLSGAALNEIYTNLGRVGNVGTANNSVTFQGTADTVTKVGHGFANLDAVRFSTITTTTGIAINTNYYVINAAADTFQVTSTLTGSPINLVNDGTGLIANATITVSSNYGTATDTPAIATAKGWTVTGS
jgi:surface protein